MTHKIIPLNITKVAKKITLGFQQGKEMFNEKDFLRQCLALFRDLEKVK